MNRLKRVKMSTKKSVPSKQDEIDKKILEHTERKTNGQVDADDNKINELLIF